jgi:hypothetical protein
MATGAMGQQRPGSATPLSVAELGIRVHYRERATLRWFAALCVGIALVVAALAIGSTGWLPLTLIGVYSVFALAMAVRSAALLARLEA